VSQHINLFNPDFHEKRELFTALMLLRALAVLLLLLAGVSAYQFRQTQLLDKQVKEGAIQLEQARADLLKVAAEYAPRAKSQVLEKRVAEMEQQLKDEEAVLQVLRGGSLGNTEGYSGYMRAFARQTLNGLWLTGFSIKGAGNDMAIVGRTLRPELVPTYIQRLNQEAVTQGRAFAALEIQQPKMEPAAQDKPAQTPNYLEFNLHSNAAEGAR
jgi:polyhydroxyalkanoate synthesis regulator phasin